MVGRTTEPTGKTFLKSERKDTKKMMGIENGHENGLRKERTQNNSLIFNTKKQA